ncbi:MAG TPA: hypothetical protein VID05_05040 [Acidimicrobiales bacterium]
MSRSLSTRPLLASLGVLALVAGVALTVVPFRAHLGFEPMTDLLPGTSTPNAKLLSDDLGHFGHSANVTVACGTPTNVAFRSDDVGGNGWFNYSPNSGVVLSPGGPPPFMCRAPAQRRILVGAGLFLAGFVVLVASRRATRPLPV